MSRWQNKRPAVSVCKCAKRGPFSSPLLSSSPSLLSSPLLSDASSNHVSLTHTHTHTHTNTSPPFFYRFIFTLHPPFISSSSSSSSSHSLLILHICRASCM